MEKKKSNLHYIVQPQSSQCSLDTKHTLTKTLPPRWQSSPDIKALFAPQQQAFESKWGGYGSSRTVLELGDLVPKWLWEPAAIKAELDICVRHTVPGNLLQELTTDLIKRPPGRSGQHGMHQHVSRELIFHGPSRIAAKIGPVAVQSHKRKNSVHTSYNVHILSDPKGIQNSLHQAHRSWGMTEIKVWSCGSLCPEPSHVLSGTSFPKCWSWSRA